MYRKIPIKKRAKKTKRQGPLTKEQYWEMKKKYLSKYGITEEDIKKNIREKENKLSSLKNTQKRKVNFISNVQILRLILDSMPGETLEEKRKNYEKIPKREIVDFIKKSKRKAPPSAIIADEEMTAGIRKIQPKYIYTLKELIKKNFDLDEFKVQRNEGKRLTHAAQEILNFLKIAGIIKKEKENGEIKEIKVINPEALEKTLETGYIPFPKLEPLYKKKKKQEEQ